ncbi:UNVERIFIED_CONTAM: hypothetical protein Slati_3110900 [Sesamum latifolium]|uniref:DDE Tnp4 domain-containing protein n=1 Tax=Sesamum latifolium TaxID=2727402 RepID=A0AAW2UU17_9LAMI
MDKRTHSYNILSRIPAQIKHLHRLVLDNDQSYLKNLRMTRNAFGRLCFLFEYNSGLCDTSNLMVSEQVAIFLSIISHHKKNAVVKHNFIRSGRTVSKAFYNVLYAILRLNRTFLARPEPLTNYCTDSRWRWFKGCMGALDGTYIDFRVPEKDKGRYRMRKGHITVNVLGVCNMNMEFIYVLTGWEGIAADSRILRDAMHRPTGLRIPTGNYYLCDNGYTNGEGFLTPYRGVRYHLREWDRGARGPSELGRIIQFEALLCPKCR